MNMEDLKKMTVADLKKELKARNLPVAGIKSELMQRLSEHILNSEEGQLLDTSGNVDESLLEGIHEDEVLGLSGNASPTALNSPQPLQKVATKKETPTKPAVASQKVVATAAVKKQDAATTNAADQSSAANGNEQKGDKSSPTDGEAPKKITLKTLSTDAADASKKVIESKAPTVSDPAEARIERAKKFNIPLSDNDRKKLRAERFGLGSSASSAVSKSASAASMPTSVPLDPDVLMKRAQRFGAPVVKTSKNISTNISGGGSEKLKQRAERFGLDKKQQQEQEKSTSSTAAPTNNGKADDEALLKRKLRFTGGGSGSGGADADQKKKARAERFAL